MTKTNNFVEGEHNTCLNYPNECWNCVYSNLYTGCSKPQHIYFKVL